MPISSDFECLPSATEDRSEPEPTPTFLASVPTLPSTPSHVHSATDNDPIFASTPFFVSDIVHVPTFPHAIDYRPESEHVSLSTPTPPSLPSAPSLARVPTENGLKILSDSKCLPSPVISSTDSSPSPRWCLKSQPCPCVCYRSLLTIRRRSSFCLRPSRLYLRLRFRHLTLESLLVPTRVPMQSYELDSTPAHAFIDTASPSPFGRSPSSLVFLLSAPPPEAFGDVSSFHHTQRRCNDYSESRDSSRLLPFLMPHRSLDSDARNLRQSTNFRQRSRPVSHSPRHHCRCLALA
ncbi:hypothetical protein EDB85DRAFT_1433856 [Lactarius pseudohatsudake]|nr:hypothetical protein EDB85DRAFT_1433856 [Lactarius pseudohatsudake]